ncbi:hypothetical protein [Methanobrevibacter millerae]|uniref:Uncharacterized protein n=1 Tax=Methanobrevibacter millerae TaxID=230361 RepID=A0A1G5UWE9_9EURY|nr:hypothetical protein [Methanobrevibacter millerae]SDA37357.1 hypothetical protein SAMN02910315_00102 [Methanobrevibacter millerae]
MIKKISVILIITLFAISVAYAVNVNDLQVPSDFSGKRSDGNYFMPKTYDNPRFIIGEFNDSSPSFKNSSMYEFWSSGEKDIFCFSNRQASDMGAIELIQIDGKKYTVSVLYASTIIDEDYINDSINYLKEFNKLNNITPIKP